MFSLTPEPIVPPLAQCPSAGGFVTFDGRVRDLNEGRRVRRLEYEAYEELALSEGNRLLDEARTKFGLDWVGAIHRIGILEIGESAVWIGCGAAHRKEAFQACEFIIDELKRRLPIWKREHYEDGPSEWIALQVPPQEGPSRAELFHRQIVMPEVGASGQAAIERARILMVGAGGLANGALPYLGAAGLGCIGIVEPDLLELSNLHRQVMYRPSDVGRPKARLAAEYLRDRYPMTRVEVFEERLDAQNADRILMDFDIVIDGTDRFDAKFLMNDVCQRLGKPFIQASVYRFDGYVQVILPGGPCLRCEWPEEPADGCVSTCAESGVLGVAPGLLGILQATEALKLILGIAGDLRERQLFVDLRDSRFESFARRRRSDCASCSGVSWQPAPRSVDWEVERTAVLAWEEPFVCLDIREESEARNELDLGQSEWRHVPLSQFDAGSVSGRTLVVCASGARSSLLTYRLRSQGVEEVFSLRGGAG